MGTEWIKGKTGGMSLFLKPPRASKLGVLSGSKTPSSRSMRTAATGLQAAQEIIRWQQRDFTLPSVRRESVPLIRIRAGVSLFVEPQRSHHEGNSVKHVSVLSGNNLPRIISHSRDAWGRTSPLSSDGSRCQGLTSGATLAAPLSRQVREPFSGTPPQTT